MSRPNQVLFELLVSMAAKNNTQVAVWAEDPKAHPPRIAAMSTNANEIRRKILNGEWTLHTAFGAIHDISELA